MKKKKTIGTILFSVINAALGLGVGAAAALMSPALKDIKDKDLGKYLIDIAGVLLLLLLAFFIQIIIHEAGHLVFGLMSGYRFSSFRVMSYMLKMENGRPVFKRLKLSGTAGQCIMIPPDLKDGKLPYRLYNLGGALMNLIASALFLALSLLLRKAGLGYSYLIILAVVGIYVALTNAVPVNTTVPNDGYNALFLGKDPNAVRSFWTQLKINQLSGEGVRVKDMPDEWFDVPEDADLGNYMTAYIAIARESRLMDKGEFGEAKELIDRLLADDVSVPTLQTALLLNDKAFLDLMENGKDADLSALEQKEIAAVLRQMKSFPSVLRTQYAVELLKNGDTGKAQEILDTFDRVAQTYPSQADIESERELMQTAKDRAASV
ncbi:MAG: hypothetical protein IKX27_04615 [Oscillospiraceae bacterium]|nr:hypothetical protein [Oscillospiraceae bacterium]